jgi:hypothetical protein
LALRKVGRTKRVRWRRRCGQRAQGARAI